MRRFLGIVALVSAACGGSSSTKIDQVAAPTFSPPPGTYATAQVVTIASATPGATVHYTEDGATPTAASPTCTAPVTVSATTTLQAIATKSGSTDSEAVTARYVIAPATPRAAAPTFSPPGGAYASAQTVTIATTTAGATIHYTTDGSTPTTSSTVYGAPITVSATTALKAFATASGFTASDVAVAAYTITLPQAAAPTFSPPGGTYAAAQTVTISSATAGATLYYTLDGSTPTSASTRYTAPFSVSTTTTVKAIAVAAGFTDSAVASTAYDITIPLPTAAAPTFAPPPGTYTSAQAVVLATTTPGASIHYTTDGSPPTTASTLYTAPVAVNANLTIRAIAAAAGYTTSDVALGTYVIAPPLPAPTFSPPAGSYTTAISVAIQSATPEVQIYFTVDGSDPTTASPPYSGPIALAIDSTLKAIATKTGFTDSPVATAAYTFAIPVPASRPTFSVPGGTYVSSVTVTLASFTPGAVIHYTTDGTTPTTASPQFTAPLTLTSTTTVTAIATAPGFLPSEVAVATYTILTPAAAPTFTPSGGTYTSPQSVTLATSSAGASIHFTTDGSTPTAASTLYTAPFTVSTTTTVRAIATGAAYVDSGVASATYVIVPRAEAPTFSPPGGTYTSTQTVTLASATVGALVYYTLDGSTPTAASDLYAGPFTVSATTTVKAFAKAAGFTDSAIATATYVINPPAQAATPTFTPPPGTYTAAQNVAIASATAGASLYYTVDGSTPTTSSTPYTAPIGVTTTTTLRAIATASGFMPSDVAVGTFTIEPPADAPTFSPPQGTYASPQTVTLATTTPGASIHYTLDGSAPTAASTLYTAPLAVSATTTVKAIAVAPGYTDSAAASATYTILLPAAAPTFTPGEGTYSSTQLVTLATTTPGASIHYTIDGSTPTTSSTPYTAAISVSTTTTIKAIAVAAGFTDSAIASATYTFLPLAATPTFTPPGGTYTAAQNVTIATTTASATLYYTTDGTTPTTSSTIYAGAIAVSTTVTVQAIATAPGFAPSLVGSATFTINTSSDVPIADFCRQVQDTVVAKMLACFNANPDYAATFRQMALAQDTCGQLTRDQASGRVLYDGTKAAACVDAVQAATCLDLKNLERLLSATCSPAITPQVQPGDPCYDEFECVGGNCNEDAGVCPGTCQTFLAAGDDCAPPTTRQCAPGLVCDTDATKTCLVSSPAGQACPCDADLWCDTGDPTFPSGTCKPQQTGGACDPRNAHCALGYLCVGAPTTTCQPLVGLGGDCSGSRYLCSLGYYCGTDNKCAPWPTLGGSCSDTEPWCLDGYCDVLATNTCVAYKNLGEACLPGQCAPGVTCDFPGTNVCVNTMCRAP